MFLCFSILDFLHYDWVPSSEPWSARLLYNSIATSLYGIWLTKLVWECIICYLQFDWVLSSELQTDNLYLYCHNYGCHILACHMVIRLHLQLHADAPSCTYDHSFILTPRMNDTSSTNDTPLANLLSTKGQKFIFLNILFCSNRVFSSEPLSHTSLLFLPCL